MPARCWKVVVVLPEGSSDASRVTTATRIIAIDTPNTTAISSAWGGYRTTVDAIEAATGYNILSAVDCSAAIDDGGIISISLAYNVHDQVGHPVIRCEHEDFLAGTEHFVDNFEQPLELGEAKSGVDTDGHVFEESWMGAEHA